MTSVVLDASVALAWLLAEHRPGWVDRLLAEDDRQASRLKVPSLFWLEVGNTLARLEDLSDEQAMDGMLRLDALGIETIEVDVPLRLRALQLARALRVTVYDAAYLALADSLRSPLASLDADLAAAAGALGLGHGDVGHRLAEEPAPYRGRADPISLAAIGAALAELRSHYITP